MLALSGYAFPPANAGDPAFVDGWDVQFTRLLVTVDKIKLSSNPDYSPDQGTLSASSLVAEVDGPWAIDLAHGDPNYLQGKGGPGEEAVPIAALSRQNQPAGNTAAFKTDGTRYAFGFDTVAATSSAMNVNIDAAGLADYSEMIQGGCAVMYVGVATFKGGVVTATTGNMADYTKCNSDPEYASWPKTVSFRLCFKSPTSFVNCQNPDNDPAGALPGEEHERGVAFEAKASRSSDRVTIHTDHPFLGQRQAARFAGALRPVCGACRAAHVVDGGAATDAASDGATSDGPAATATASTTPTVTLDMTMGVDYRSYTDSNGNPLKWRYCMDPPTDVHAQLTGAMAFDPQSVPHATGTDRTTGSARLLRLHHLQPEHAGPPELRRPVRVAASLLPNGVAVDPAPKDLGMSTIDSVKHVLLVSGASWILWLLGGLSVSSLVVAMERWLYLRRRGGDLEALARSLDQHLASGDFATAHRLLEASPSVAARIADAGLRLADRGTDAADKAMQSAAALERGRLERWLAYLATVGNNAPFVGLFGTVVGVIHAFEELGHAAPGHGAPAAAQVASQAVMASIAEALVATAVGILVALPAVATYNYLQRRVASLLSGADVLTNLVLAYIADDSRRPSAPPKLREVAHGGV